MLSNVGPKRRNYLSARRASAENVIFSDTDIFHGRSVSVNDWLISDTFLLNSEILSISCAKKLRVSYGLKEVRQFKINLRFMYINQQYAQNFCDLTLFSIYALHVSDRIIPSSGAVFL